MAAMTSTGKGEAVTRFYIFIFRAVLGAAFAVILVRMFHPRAGLAQTAGLGIFLTGMAYVSEYFRNRNR